MVGGWRCVGLDCQHNHEKNHKQGLLMDIVVGIVGAFVGGFLFNEFGSAGITGFNIWSVFVAVVGAVVLLALIRLLSRQGLLPS